MTLIAVAPTKFSRGIGREGSKADFLQRDLIEALEDTYNTDAHAVGYIDTSRVGGWQHRWRKEDIECPIVDASALVLGVVFVDVDNPGHVAWTPETMAEAIASFDRLPLPCGVYLTAHGYRLVLPLATPVPVRLAERVIHWVLSQLDAAGVRVDWAVKDWTRHFRMPNVRRDGRPYVPPFVDFSRMRAIDIELPPEEAIIAPEPVSTVRMRRPRLPPSTWTSTLAEHWQARARVVGETIRGTVGAEYHRMYLAIGGALLARSVPPEHVPELVRLIATHAGSVKPAHHEASARGTVARYMQSQHVTGWHHLVHEHPTVADALDDALDDAVERPAAVAAAPALDATTAALHGAIREAGDGLTVIRAECGLGKTRAAQNVAVERARKLHLHVVDSERAPSQSKTAISVDKNELAKQVARDVHASGISVRRLFGPLSTGECRMADRAGPLVNGGQSLQWEFCLGRGREKCEHYSTCTAKDGEELLGAAPARITVGTHALLAELDASAGTTGLLVIDEPPPLLEVMTITEGDIDIALRRVHDFELSFARSMSSLLLALREWSDPDHSFAEVTAGMRVEVEDTKRPPLRASASALARRSVFAAQELGAASRVMLALVRALSDRLVSVRLEREPTRRVVVTSTRIDLTEALRREGSVIVLDANADNHLPAFRKVVGYEPVMHEFAASDGAPVERTLLRSGASTRRAWLAHGRLVLESGLVSALREVVAWANETRLGEIRPVRLGIITMRVVRLAIEGALRPRDGAIDKAWADAKQKPSTLAEARTTLAEVLGAFRGEFALAHYGATRGLNTMSDVDCLATVGDPWPSLPDVRNEATYLGVDADDRMRRLCEAELEQAHGRLRAVHRTRPARALHVGRVTPGGSAWASSAVLRRRMLGGRPRNAEAMSIAELSAIVERLGGVANVARVAGCSHSTIVRYLGGRSVTPAVAVVLRSAAAIGVSGRTHPDLKVVR